jgi:ABC-type nitrate/sulfonate/bicarbonate transport system substrate-binding protein
MFLSCTRILCLVAALIGTLNTPTFAQTKLRFGYPLAVNGEIPIAMERAGIAQKWGFSGEFISFQNGPAMFEAFAGGRLDVVMTSILPALVFMSKVPGDFRILAVPGRSTSSLLVGKHSSGTSLPDLKGKKIAVSFSTSQHFDLLRGLADSKMTSGDVTLLNMPPSDLPLALQRELVDAVVAFQPQILKLKQESNARAVLTWPFYFVVGMSAKFRADNPGSDRKFLGALHETLAYIAEHRDETSRWLGEALRMDPALVRAVAVDDASAVPQGSDPSAEPTAGFKKVFVEWADAAYALGMIKARVDMGAAFD